MKILRLVIFAAVVYLSMAGCSKVKPVPASPLFSSPEEAVAVLRHALQSKDQAQLRAIFGADGEYLLTSGDPQLDTNRVDKFKALFQEKYSWHTENSDSIKLLVGNKSWPFPVPLRRYRDRWYFDAAAGREEILKRRIGANELSTLDVQRTIYGAQRLYASQTAANGEAPRYATKFISSPGKKDGLYWPARDGEPMSPLGPLAIKAASEHYFIHSKTSQPFHGYVYRLASQPPLNQASASSSGNSLDIFSTPGTFWSLASPANWGLSGIMSFAVNERGWIYEKNCGSEGCFAKDFAIVIDDSWSRIE